MNFISTRGICKDEVSSAYAIKTGLAPDGGLYMPTDIPSLEVGELRELSKMTYPERAARIIGKFLTDYTEDELLEDALDLARNFAGGGEITLLHRIDFMYHCLTHYLRPVPPSRPA